MTFEAKTFLPLPCDPDAANGAFEEAAGSGVALLEEPGGYLLTEGLALAFTRLDRRPIWLRLGPEDRDPATFLLSLVAAARRLQHDAGEGTLTLMKQQPGPVFGWPPLFWQLGRDLRFGMTSHDALVLEDVHRASAHGPTLSLVSRYLLPGLADATSCVLLAHQTPQAELPGTCLRRSASELGLPAPTVRRLLDEWAPDLPARARSRALAIIGGRAAIVAGLRELVAATGYLQPLLERAATREELVTRTAEILLADAGREARGALGLAARIEYAHPSMTSAITGQNQLPPGPWLQLLDDGWVRIRPCWRRPLVAVLGERAMPGQDRLHQLADWLLDAGASDRAVSLYLDVGDYDCAARVITSRASTLMDLGQWATLDRWLVRLPEDVLTAYPDLSCAWAEIASVRGDTATAQRWFDIAAGQYARRNDVEGECRGILSGSAVAAGAGDLAGALSRASAASSLATTAELAASRMWATWQLGRVALAAGDSDGALASFCGAASSVVTCADVTAASLVTGTGDLAMRVRELRRQQESHREAQAALRRAEHEALNQLMTAASTPVPGNEALFGTDGWTRVPAPLKFPAAVPPASVPEPDARPLRWRRALLPHRAEPSSGRAPLTAGHDPVVEAGPAADGDNPVPAARPAAGGDGPPADAAAPGAAARPAGPSGEMAATSQPRLPAQLATSSLSPAAVDPAPELAVHLLGPLCVAVDDVAVGGWPSARCRSLFGYLLTHREAWPPREVLMEAFWPESSPEASRNSLNVAIHALRRTLRGITDIPVVVHDNGVYRINRCLRLWLDVEEFDRRVESGRTA